MTPPSPWSGLPDTANAKSDVAPPRLLSADMHFHANIAFQTPKRRASRLAKLAMRVGHLDILASTEHAYKEPLEAYDALVEMVERHRLALEILPGVENISAEGIEMIQIARSREDLRRLLTEWPAFGWSIRDLDRLDETDCVSILPHPFTPSRTGLVTRLGREAAIKLLPRFDYIEASNGSYTEVDRLLGPTRLRPSKVRLTARFPGHLLPEGIGVSHGSDAHFPEDLNIFGKVAAEGGNSFYDLLGKRHRMEFAEQTAGGRGTLTKLTHNMATSSVEYMQKQAYRRRVTA